MGGGKAKEKRENDTNGGGYDVHAQVLASWLPYSAKL